MDPVDSNGFQWLLGSMRIRYSSLLYPHPHPLLKQRKTKFNPYLPENTFIEN
jgi:hypothetical protein